MSDRLTGPALQIGFVLTPGMLVTGTALPYEMWLAAIDFRQAARRRVPQLKLRLVDAVGTAARGRQLPVARGRRSTSILSGLRDGWRQLQQQRHILGERRRRYVAQRLVTVNRRNPSRNSACGQP